MELHSNCVFGNLVFSSESGVVVVNDNNYKKTVFFKII